MNLHDVSIDKTVSRETHIKYYMKFCFGITVEFSKFFFDFLTFSLTTGFEIAAEIPDKQEEKLR